MGRLILRLLGTPEVSHNVHALDDSASFSAASGTSENQLCHTCWRRSGGKLDLPEAKEDQHRHWDHGVMGLGTGSSST
jgi:hypothetical protein